MSATPSPSELDRLRLLYDLGCAFAAHTDIDELIPFVIRQCRDVLGAEGASILLLDAETGDLVIPYVAAIFCWGQDGRRLGELKHVHFYEDRYWALIAGEPNVEWFRRVRPRVSNPRLQRTALARRR